MTAAQRTSTTQTTVTSRPAERTKTRVWQKDINETIASEVSLITRYCDRLIQWRPGQAETFALFDAINCERKDIVSDIGEIPDLQTEETSKVAILINGNLNHDLDIQGTLLTLKSKMSRNSRIVAVLYNPYMAWLFKLATALGLRSAEDPCTFVTEVALRNLATISGFELVRLRSSCVCPFRLAGIGDVINKIIPALPFTKWFSLTAVAVLRPVFPERKPPSLSIIIPARNERGNIEPALQRLQYLQGIDHEVVFVEGHSTDQTWEEIDRVIPLYPHMQLSAHKQSGKGKSDAVRLGFAHASKDILVILDADLSVPPELLKRFYDAYCEGRGDFINGSRLVYPIEGQAMKFLNKIGNAFFAKALSYVLGVNLSDSLCGTKLFSRDDYDRMTRWRADFGDFDPFGDFEMLFPAAQQALGVIDIPIHYRDRLYGETNIRRFYHGLMLLKMTLIGFAKIHLAQTPHNKYQKSLLRKD